MSPQLVYHQFPLPRSVLDKKFTDLTVGQVFSFFLYASQVSANMTNHTRLRNDISPYSDEQMLRITIDYYKCPPSNYDELLHVITQHTFPQHPMQRHVITPHTLRYVIRPPNLSPSIVTLYVLMRRRGTSTL
jgi:hypothetical protein